MGVILLLKSPYNDTLTNSSSAELEKKSTHIA